MDHVIITCARAITREAQEGCECPIWEVMHGVSTTGITATVPFSSFISSALTFPLASYKKRTCGSRMGQECRERFPRHRFQRKPLVSDPSMHHGTCVTHVPWCMSGSLTRGGGENVLGIPGAYVTRNFTYLVRGWYMANHSGCHCWGCCPGSLSHRQVAVIHLKTGALQRLVCVIRNQDNSPNN